MAAVRINADWGDQRDGADSGRIADLGDDRAGFSVRSSLLANPSTRLFMPAFSLSTAFAGLLTSPHLYVIVAWMERGGNPG